MSISAMKQALEALELGCTDSDGNEVNLVTPAITALRQAIAEAEKQEPVAWNGECVLGHCGSPSGCDDLGCCRADAAPVHASDIPQERVDETAKRKHEWVGLDGDIPGLGLVTEEFYNGMLCAEDILRKRNT